MKRVYLAALTGQTDPQSNEEVQGEFCISTLAVSANISNSYSSHNHQFKQLYVSTSYFDLSPLCPDLLEDPKCDTMTGNLMIRDNLAPKLRRSSVPVHSDGRAHRGLTKNEPPAPKLTPVILTEICSCTCFLATMTEAGEVQTPDPRQPLNELNLAKERQNYGRCFWSKIRDNKQYNCEPVWIRKNPK